MTPEDLAARISATFLHRPFGILRVYGFAAFRPNDQRLVVTSARAEGDRIDLALVDADRGGPEVLLRVWQPEGLEAAPVEVGAGIAIRSASRVAYGNISAEVQGDRAVVTVPSGVYPRGIGGPALVLAG